MRSEPSAEGSIGPACTQAGPENDATASTNPPPARNHDILLQALTAGQIAEVQIARHNAVLLLMAAADAEQEHAGDRRVLGVGWWGRAIQRFGLTAYHATKPKPNCYQAAEMREQ